MSKGMATEMYKNGTNALTFADINNECSRNRCHVNPLTGKVLYLKPIV